jgi:hypothetical protein
MKNKTLAVMLALAAGLVAAGTAQAEGKIYVGAKGGLMMANYTGFNDALNLGIYGGFNLLGQDAQFAADLKGGTLAVEGEVTMSPSKGKFADPVTGATGKWDNTSVGLFAAYRYPLTDAFYLKGKVGLAHDDISATGSLHDGATTKLAVGVGGGWKVGPGAFEAEVTTHEGDITFLSAGFHMTF